MSFYDHHNDGVIHVEYNSVQMAADDMRNQTKAIQNTVIALNEELDSLRTAWQGMDAATYQEKQNAWNAASDALATILDNHSRLLEEIVQIYRQHENRSASEWSQIKV
ncbi:WXG100 family type VII secretion target [Streptomyces palmae]|uniref:ESAT-6-like protein n=1 Tax=Streptomyces palmae TaxID=1701085 RepID=A0A4Z0H532_9ACTN|nr:WXG100 family type VII secretion target [Streptomyces palmae]TGB05605.1 WXG100 family type VII secretion target [Streptomyces palmae]